MNIFDDAQRFMKSKETQTRPVDDENVLVLQTPAQEEMLFAQLKKLYENATRPEIERAVHQVKEQMENPYDKALFMKKIRVKLED